MMLSLRDLAAISKSLGRTRGSISERLDRVTGPEYNKANTEFEHVTELLARVEAEEVKRRNNPT